MSGLSTPSLVQVVTGHSNQSFPSETKRVGAGSVFVTVPKGYDFDSRAAWDEGDQLLREPNDRTINKLMNERRVLFGHRTRSGRTVIESRALTLAERKQSVRREGELFNEPAHLGPVEVCEKRRDACVTVLKRRGEDGSTVPPLGVAAARDTWVLETGCRGKEGEPLCVITSQAILAEPESDWLTQEDRQSMLDNPSVIDAPEEGQIRSTVQSPKAA